MKTKMVLLGVFVLILLTAEKCNDSAVSDNCKNVPRLDWQVEEKGYDSETALKLVAELQAAAKADAEAIQGMDELEADVDLSSELAKTINKNVKQKSKVSQDFWEQDLTYRQTLCFYESMVNNKKISEEVKSKYHEAILEMGKIRTAYMFEQKKRTGSTQK
ncbi:hypothetical protein [Salibacter halophilus]|uniref:Uncharacterized protein n=1 Tax=Salibacter halophilus TaxID=1803916 RepID=A0A6N6M680_9FLAO|nr:hypothetical protein [Salibacter halophilus]KAB1065221.1 hypothetical protein F3059_04505 [Salibacter halophilus]